MKKFKEIIKTTFNYLYEVLILFSFMWAVILAVSFSYVLPKEGLTILALVIIITIVDRLYKWIKHKGANQH